jgi:large subunit ribosomal protein L2
MGDKILILMPSKKEKEFNGKCRAIIGSVAGSGRLDKPIVKAGKSFYIKKTRNKLWPRTSAVKMNAIDHPFGSGRGKRIKSKIAKRNAPPGAKVGLIRPSRTGKKKR